MRFWNYSVRTIEFAFSKAYNRRQNIWQILKASNKIRQEQQTSIYTSAYILTAIAKNLIL